MGGIQYSKVQDDPAAAFLEFFYPVHYQVGKALEDVMRSGRLSRKQVAMLWLIRSEGVQGSRMRRKEIHQRIATWFEISSPSMTRALRAMARPPLSLVRLAEDPTSGREKMVILTPKGERFLAEMVEQGKQFLQPLIAQFSPEEISTGLQFFRRGMAIVQQAHIGRLTHSSHSDVGSERFAASGQVGKSRKGKTQNKSGDRRARAVSVEEVRGGQVSG
jgi:DNA-binding MarR family transcriptional regulator